MRKQVLLGILVGGMLTACHESEVMDYALDGRVYFYERVKMGGGENKVDSKTYSFAIQNDTVQKDTFKINVRLMGYVADHDRTFRAVAVPDSTTAIEGTHYHILDGVLKAGAYEGFLPVEIYRTDDTKDKEVKLYLRLTPTDDLAPGNSTDISFKLTWGNKLVRPANWPYYFGEYSDNKYRFAIDQLGLSDWPQANRYQTGKVEGVYTAAELQRFATLLNEAYTEYRKTHSPIYIDDADPSRGEIYYSVSTY